MRSGWLLALTACGSDAARAGSGTDAGADAAPAAVDSGSDGAPADLGPDSGPDAFVDKTPEQVGDACETVEDCENVPGTAICLTTVGVEPLEYTWPGGYCTSICDLLETGSCGTQAICVAYPGYPGLCVKTCTDDSNCRTEDGYICLALPGIPLGVCGTPASFPPGGG